jgi:hypothetical protein
MTPQAAIPIHDWSRPPFRAQFWPGQTVGHWHVTKARTITGALFIKLMMVIGLANNHREGEIKGD